MREYQLFFKDCLSLNSMAKANTVCLAFSIERDILEGATSSFTVNEIPKNVNEGDVLGLVDPYGTIVYEGVVTSIEADGQSVQASQIESLFNDNWLYRVPEQTTIENALLDVIQNDFQQTSDTIMTSKYGVFTVTAETQTSGVFVSEEQVINFESFLYSIFNNFGVRLYIHIPFEAGTPTITIARREYTPLKVGNNARIITSITPTTEVQQTNKLVIYSQENEYRATYYRTEDGATTNPSAPTRLPVVNTEFVFSDDEISTIINQYFSEAMYNHYIEYEMLLNNKLYDFYNMELGQPLAIWVNLDYYDSIYTGYSMSKEERGGIGTVIIKCGKVRSKLTSKIMEMFQ